MIEEDLRHALRELADDVPANDGLAPHALSRARRHAIIRATTLSSVAAAVVAGVGLLALDAGPLEHTRPEVASRTALAGRGSEAPTVERDMTPEQLSEAFNVCAIAAGPGNYSGWEPAFGIVIEGDAAPATATRWVVSHRGEEYRADCALGAGGELFAGGGAYGAKSSPELLYALVDGQEGLGVGRYASPVDRVTLQTDHGEEVNAVTRHGFWFFPISARAAGPSSAGEGGSGGGLIGVPPGHTVRGYDSEGALVYDSAVDGPSVDACYADPTGTSFVGSWAGQSDPADCVRTIAWEPLP